MDIVSYFKDFTQKTINALKEDLKSIRTGRATPALIENLQVLTYGGSTNLKLMELATIATEGPQVLIIAPFDPSVIADIEKAILSSSIGLSPATQGTRIVVKTPPLSQEQREKFLKLAGQKVEERRVSVRGQRDDARRKIKSRLEKKEITEDMKFRLEKEIDIEASKAMEEMDKIRETKEKEILEI